MTEARMSGHADAASVAPSAPAGSPANARVTAVQASNDWWQQLDQRIYQCIKLWVDQWWETQHHTLIEAVGEVFGQERDNQREAIAKIKGRVIRLEATNSLDVRFTKLANEVKGGPEIQQSELLARIEHLQRQLDELKRVAAQPGPQGPPGPPGKLPLVREYVSDRVHYERDVVTHAGALWQAQCDTVHAPPHEDWALLARAGRDAATPTICGTYNAYGKYKKLDIVVSDGAAFIAKRDDPGICPGDGWQLMSRQGRQGRKGEDGARGPHGEKGEKGEPGTTIVAWQLDRQHYCINPLMSDGEVGPMLELRPMFEQFLAEVGQ
jgi:hypothetical protein